MKAEIPTDLFLSIFWNLYSVFCANEFTEYKQIYTII